MRSYNALRTNELMFDGADSFTAVEIIFEPPPYRHGTSDDRLTLILPRHQAERTKSNGPDALTAQAPPSDRKNKAYGLVAMPQSAGPADGG